MTVRPCDGVRALPATGWLDPRGGARDIRSRPRSRLRSARKAGRTLCRRLRTLVWFIRAVRFVLCSKRNRRRYGFPAKFSSPRAPQVINNEQHCNICPGTKHSSRVQRPICIENLIGRPSRVFGRACRGLRLAWFDARSLLRGFVIYAARRDCAPVLWACFMRRCPSFHERKGILT